jgi:hypothetical protein
MNSRIAEAGWASNILTWNQYMELLDMESIGTAGDIYKFERDRITNVKPTETDEQAIN